MFCPVLLFGQADQGVITGIVSDPQGTEVPNATVVITNSATGVATTVKTSSAGNYSTPPLIIGNYEVRVEVPGFKVFSAKGIRLDSGQTFRQDVHLEIGSVSESVEVNANSELLNTENPQVSASISQKYYEDLPAIITGNIRVPEALLYTVPGFTPRSGGNDQFFSRINGGQAAAFENFLDGASYGEVVGHNFTAERSAPFESIQEARVIQNTFSAQYGHTSGGFVEYTTKSGTSHYHGVLYEYFQNNVLNARGEIARTPPVLRQNNYGAAVGGPIWIPKLYNGKNKSFFFYNYDGYKFRNSGDAGFLTVAPGDFRSGNFSALLGANTGKSDACGRPVFAGQIFDPLTTRDAATCGGPAGAIVRDPFPGNIVPLRSTVAKNITALLPGTTRPGFIQNLQATSDQRYLNVVTQLVRLDHNFTDNLKASLTFNYNDRPRLIGCASVGSCDLPEGGTRFQDISTQTAHLQLTDVIRPNLFTHGVFSYDRWVLPDGYHGGLGYVSKLGLKGIPFPETAGFPAISFPNSPYSSFGQRVYDRFEASDRYQFLNDTTYIFGKHTLKVGIEFRHERWTIGQSTGDAGTWRFNTVNTAAFDASGNPIAGTGDAFATFVLGQVSNANIEIRPLPAYSRNYFAPWINDDIKLTSQLTLSFGYRMDFQLGRHEKHDIFTSFNPTRPNPAAGNRPGAIDFANVNGVGRQFEKTDTSTYGPRFGFAYRLKDKTTIRGGYGIYYAGVTMNQFAAQASLGFATNPTVTDTTNGRQAAFLFDDGFPQSALTFPPNKNPGVGVNSSVLYMNPNAATLPRYQNWTLSIQHQLTNNMLLDVAYVANHGTRLISPPQISGLNQNNPNILQKYPVSLLTSNINSTGAVAAGIPLPYPGFDGSVAQALRPFPQYQDVNPQNGADGMSTYNGLQVKLEKNFSSGLLARMSYTWSKLLNNGADNGLSATTQDFAGNFTSVYRREKGLSDGDVPHTLIVSYDYELPVGRGKRFLNNGGVANLVLGGWHLAGVHRYESGRPIGIVVDNLYSGVLFNSGLRPDRVLGISGFKDHDNSHFDIVTGRYLDPAAFTLPSPGTLGTEGRTDPILRGWATYNENVSLFKDFKLRESIALRFGSNFSNILNRHVWSNPDTNFSHGSNFGLISGQNNEPRHIEFYLRLNF
ncbi:MAG: carboxypeptidase regulatory-like domain-containing protein [Bryobacteraceae bacterium]